MHIATAFFIFSAGVMFLALGGFIVAMTVKAWRDF